MKKMKKHGRAPPRRSAFLDPATNEAGRAARPPGRRVAGPPGEEDGGGWSPREVRRLGYPVPLDREREFREAGDRESCSLRRDGDGSRFSREQPYRRFRRRSRENARHRRTRSIEMAPPNRQAGRQAGGQKINRVYDTRGVF